MQAGTKTVEDINTVSEYLSNPDLSTLSAADCIVICASAILHQAENLFQSLQTNPSLTKCLVLCGGIGHSTHYIHEAVANHPIFSRIAGDVIGLSEARVLEKILNEFFDTDTITSHGCQILVEDKSTNCGLNASLSRNVLDKAGIHPTTCIIIQDPTMMRRTIASFKKAYEDVIHIPEFIGYPVFVPRMTVKDVVLAYDDSIPTALWPQSRFLELLIGEIPRLRDDENGYGPNGKGFIPHVEVPHRVEEAWMRLRGVSDATR
ncbi:hypothetical protein AWENTII_011825 [Aspergillus wentii]|nr:hypothetical protein MW887_006275 [Aspergillus wentii]